MTSPLSFNCEFRSVTPSRRLFQRARPTGVSPVEESAKKMARPIFPQNANDWFSATTKTKRFIH
jgi:hypothetical protein